MAPSQKDISKLKKFAEIVKSGKKLSTKSYLSLCKCETLPKYIIKHIEYYYNLGKQYGGEFKCKELWPTKDIACTQNTPYNSPTLGQGAYGSVIDNGDDTVTKIFTIDTLDVLEHLKTNLPLIFQKVSEFQLNIYLSLIELSDTSIPDKDNKLAYKMAKLSKVREIVTTYINSPGLHNIIFNRAMSQIEKMHENGIIHCDLKLDNLMYRQFADGNVTKRPNVNDLARHLSQNIVIIDFDGCIQLDQPIMESLSRGHEYHSITPIFAHSYLIENLLLGKETTQSLWKNHNNKEIHDVLTVIENYRNNVEIGESYRNIIDHRMNHIYIFDALSYASVFGSEREEDIIKYLKFADYYTLCMDFLFTKKINQHKLKKKDVNNPGKLMDMDEDEKENLIKEYTFSILNFLTQKAIELGLKPQSGGTCLSKYKSRKMKKGGGNPVILNVNVSVPNASVPDKTYITHRVGQKQPIPVNPTEQSKEDSAPILSTVDSNEDIDISPEIEKELLSK